jgi:di/tricarboxylate transporter
MTFEMYLTLGILVIAILLFITEWLRVDVVALGVVVVLMLTGILTPGEAISGFSSTSVITIVALFVVGGAVMQTGLAGLFLITSLFTKVLSNTTTAVLVAPIALATAQNLDLQPHAFMMAVAIAASMAFASPVASPVNTLVMGAGNYRFGDYIKVGIPLIFVAMVVTTLVLPIIWPF